MSELTPPHLAHTCYKNILFREGEGYNIIIYICLSGIYFANMSLHHTYSLPNTCDAMSMLAYSTGVPASIALYKSMRHTETAGLRILSYANAGVVHNFSNVKILAPFRQTVVTEIVRYRSRSASVIHCLTCICTGNYLALD